MADAFAYTPGDKAWRMPIVKRITEEQAALAPSCGAVRYGFYIGADGMVAPCQGMCDCDFAENLPNLYETPLTEILRDSAFVTLTGATVKDIRDHNQKCRECAYTGRCTGGCRNSVLMRGDDYYSFDEPVCFFFENGWEERLTRAAEEPFRAYLKRNPPKESPAPDKNAQTAEVCL